MSGQVGQGADRGDLVEDRGEGRCQAFAPGAAAPGDRQPAGTVQDLLDEGGDERCLRRRIVLGPDDVDRAATLDEGLDVKPRILGARQGARRPPRGR